MLPPEFLVFGITKENYEPWTPVDCMLMARIISYQLTWNWAADLQREGLRQAHPDLNALVEELNPFTSDYLYDVVPALEDDDLKKINMFSQKSLLEKYRQSTETLEEAAAPLPDDFDDSLMS